MSWKATDIHPEFSYNGTSFSKEELLAQAKRLTKEGEAFEQAIGDFLLSWLSADPFVSVQTSGSTGTPKTLKLQKKQLLQSALATIAYFKLLPKQRIFMCLPADYIAGKMLLVRAMVGGLHLFPVAPSSNPLEKISDSFDFAAMVPMQAMASINQLDQIKTLIIGGAPVTTALTEQLKGVSTVCYETYGMTETITHIAVRQLNRNKPSETESLFKALPHVKLRSDHRNCLVIDAPLIADKEIITNDLVELKTETAFRWLGRFDHIINSGGIKLIPEQLEAKFAPYIPTAFIVYGALDEVLGQKLVLLLEGQKGDDALLRALKVSAGLTKFEIPKEIKILPSFIRTPNGKIKRKETIALVN